MTIELINFIDLSLEEKKMVLEWRNHNSIRRYMYNQEIISLENHLKYIESLKKSRDKRYFLVKREDSYLGVIDFTNIKKDSCHFGLYSKPNLKGVGDTLLQTIIDYAFNNLKTQTLKLEVLESNIRAIKLYKRFKFKEIDIKNGYICMELKNETLKV
jgi:UDP-4-amino-4,6-dideoxy-N-acetyl-beta-L-altrosamine N-acetyltransferase